MKLSIYHLIIVALSSTVFIKLSFANHHQDDHDSHTHDSHTHDSHTHGAHVHGEADLLVAQDGNKIQIEFQSPAANILGFEYTPKSKEEHKKLDAALIQLKKASDLFDFKSADCLLTNAQIENPFLVKKEHKDDHHDHSHKHGKGHDKKVQSSSEHHSKSEHSEHKDFQVIYQYECKSIKKLTEMKVDFLKMFSGIEKLKVQWIVNDKQGSVTLLNKKESKNRDLVKF